MALYYYSSRLCVLGTVMFIIIRKVVGLVSHSIAIICTIFRLVYRGRMHQLWWEDAWAALALVADGIIFLVCCLGRHCLPGMYLDRRSDKFMDSRNRFYQCAVFRAARMSSHFLDHPRRQSLGIQDPQTDDPSHRSVICVYVGRAARSEAQYLQIPLLPPGQIIGNSADFTADVSLVAAPLHLLKNAGLSRSKKVLIQSAFCASLLITAVTIPHSTLLILGTFNTTTLMFAHIKAALSLTVCNLLAIATFLYRVYSKDTFDPDQSNGIFTSVIMMGSSTDTLTSFSLQKGITSRQIRVQTRGMEG
ncbi:hypothetical protein F4604DRAFT_1682392 [Suillus subluteus]|nr:hypothetical protein F4604DRAFT_1682392 [Suillus subluteus]